jgi:hypothetical protein
MTFNNPATVYKLPEKGESSRSCAMVAATDDVTSITKMV